MLLFRQWQEAEGWTRQGNMEDVNCVLPLRAKGRHKSAEKRCAVRENIAAMEMRLMVAGKYFCTVYSLYSVLLFALKSSLHKRSRSQIDLNVHLTTPTAKPEANLDPAWERHETLRHRL